MYSRVLLPLIPIVWIAQTLYVVLAKLLRDNLMKPMLVIQAVHEQFTQCWAIYEMWSSLKSLRHIFPAGTGFLYCSWLQKYKYDSYISEALQLSFRSPDPNCRLWGTFPSVGNVAQPPFGKASGERGWRAGPTSMDRFSNGKSGLHCTQAAMRLALAKTPSP